MPDRVIQPAKRLEASLEVPGDKSISHRALLLAVLAEGSGQIINLSPAIDVASSAAAVAALNPQVSLEGGPSKTLMEPIDSHILVHGLSGRVAGQPMRVDAGNSGTTIRLLCGILAGIPCEALLTGDDSILVRPMARVIEPLRAMGADIGSSSDGLAPLSIRGRTLAGRNHDLPIPSAQVKSALLLAGTQASGTTSVREPSQSRDHTERMLPAFGCPVEREASRLVVKSTKLLMPPEIDVPGDMSSAAPFLAAAAILPGSDLLISDVGLNPTRIGFLDLLRRYGAVVEVADVREVSGEPRGSVRVRAHERRPLEVSGEALAGAIDELPLLAVLGAFSEGVTVLTGARELRVKESDRIEATVALVRSMGGAAQALPDGFIITGTGRGLSGGRADAHGDHRMAMAAAVAALGSAATVDIVGWEAVAVSYPTFFDDLEQVVIR